MASGPPTIFASARKEARRARQAKLQAQDDAARFVIEDMVEDVLERLAFLRHEPARSLVIGDWSGVLANRLGGEVESVDVFGRDRIDPELPFPGNGHDLIACPCVLDTVNDLPGALIHIRNALAPGGLAIASFLGAGSLPARPAPDHACC